MDIATKTPKKKSMNILRFKIKSSENFTNFLKRFKTIERGLLLELTPETLRAEAHTADRGIVKSSSIPLDTILEGNVPSDLIKIGIFDIGRVIDMFKHFEETDELFLELNYEKVQEKEVGTKLKFISPNLKFNLTCADLDHFTYVSQSAFDKITAVIEENKNAEFSFPRESFNKVSSLCSFDSGEDRLVIEFSGGEINFKGESFNYLLGADPDNKNITFSFYKARFLSIDEENSNFLMESDKMLINSVESDTQVIIGRVS